MASNSAVPYGHWLTVVLYAISYYTPRCNEVERGVYWFHLVRPSLCPSVDRIVSALYLQQYSSDPFHICTSYQATSEGLSRVMFVSKFNNLKFWRSLLICYFNFVLFWPKIQYDWIVWVTMRRRGVSSESRCSGCSNYIKLCTISQWHNMIVMVFEINSELIVWSTNF